MSTPARLSPHDAWATLLAGNDRFVAGTRVPATCDASRRAETITHQAPHTVVFGCSDSRAAAEMIFDQGIGDMFVVRTAGHVLDTSVIGSIEYGVDILHVPLVVVLGHDNCGAIAAAAHTLATGEQPRGFVRAVVDRVIPSIVNITSAGPQTMLPVDPVSLLREHVRLTVDMLHSYSAGLASAVSEGRCAIVGAKYALAEGRVDIVEVIGSIDGALGTDQR